MVIFLISIFLWRLCPKTKMFFIDTKTKIFQTNYGNFFESVYFLWRLRLPKPKWFCGWLLLDHECNSKRAINNFYNRNSIIHTNSLCVSLCKFQILVWLENKGDDYMVLLGCQNSRKNWCGMKNAIDCWSGGCESFLKILYY